MLSAYIIIKHVPHHRPVVSPESRLSLPDQVSPSTQELGKGREDRGHEKLQPWRNKNTEPPTPRFCRPLRCSKFSLLVVVPSSRVRPLSIVTLSPSRGRWPAGQLESSSHRPQNWRPNWKAKNTERFKTHPFPTLQEASLPKAWRGDASATPAIFSVEAPVEQREGGTLGLERFLAFRKTCGHVGVAPCLILLWVTKGLLQVWLQKIRRFPGVCLSLPPE